MKNDAITGGPVNSSYGIAQAILLPGQHAASAFFTRCMYATLVSMARNGGDLPRGSGNLARRMTRLAGHGLVRVSVLRRWEMTPAGWNLIRAVESEIREESAKSPGATIGA